MPRRLHQLHYKGCDLGELPTLIRYRTMWQARQLALWLADLHLNPRRWETLRPGDLRPHSWNPKSPGRIIDGVVHPGQRPPSIGVAQPGDVPLWAHIQIDPEPRISFKGVTLRITPDDYQAAQQMMEVEGLLPAWQDYYCAWHRTPLFRISGQRGGGYQVRPNGHPQQCQAALIALAHTREWVARAPLEAHTKPVAVSA